MGVDGRGHRSSGTRAPRESEAKTIARCRVGVLGAGFLLAQTAYARMGHSQSEVTA